MKKLTELTTFLLDLNLFAAEQLESFVDDLKITPSCRKTQIEGRLIITEMHYTAVLFIERFPHHAVPASLLMAHISSWFIDHDPVRIDPFEFQVIVDVIDEQAADLEIRILFRETVEASENTGGAIQFNGKRYAIDA